MVYTVESLNYKRLGQPIIWTFERYISIEEYAMTSVGHYEIICTVGGVHYERFHCIRASVDALCRDETDQISRDPHTKSILTRRERLAIIRNTPAVAHGFISSCTYAVIRHTYLGVLHARICSHAISGFSCHHHHIIILHLLQ